MINVEEAGLYSLAAQVCSIISFLTMSFNNAFVPWLYNKLVLNDLQINLKIVKNTYLYLFGLCLLGFISIFTFPFIIKLFINKDYHNSIKFIPLVIFGFIFQGMYFMVTNYISYSEKTYYQAIVTVLVGIINISLNYYLSGSFFSIKP